MNRNSIKHISVILKDVFIEHGIDKKVQKHEIINEWPNIVGDKISKISRVDKIVGHTLIVRLENNSWRTELILQRENIIKRLNEKMGQVLVKEIRFI